MTATEMNQLTNRANIDTEITLRRIDKLPEAWKIRLDVKGVRSFDDAVRLGYGAAA